MRHIPRAQVGGQRGEKPRLLPAEPVLDPRGGSVEGLLREGEGAWRRWSGGRASLLLPRSRRRRVVLVRVGVVDDVAEGGGAAQRGDVGKVEGVLDGGEVHARAFIAVVL